MLATTDESFADLQRHYRQIGTVYPTYFDCRRGDAGIIGKDDPLVTRWAQLRKIAGDAALQLPARADAQHDAAQPRRSGRRRSTNLVGLVQQHGYDGINLDFEAGFETDRDALTSFVAELGRAAACRSASELAVEVSAKFYGTPDRSLGLLRLSRRSAASPTRCS